MNQLAFYKERLETLVPDDRRKFEYLYSLAENYSAVRMFELSDQYDLRRDLIPRQKRAEFTANEMAKAIEGLTSVSLRCDWSTLSGELSLVREEIRTAVKEGRYYWNEHEEELNVLFMFVATYSGLLDVYFDKDDFVVAPCEYDITTLKDFDKIIELMGQYRWIITLSNVIENSDYNGAGRKSDKKPLTYDDLWQNPQHGARVKELLESAKITIGGTYKPNLSRCSNSKTEMLKAYYVLRSLMKQHQKIFGAKCFLCEFNVPVTVSDKALSTEPSPYITESVYFTKLFTSILPKK